MIDSTLLLDHHQDPFDRVLIAQAKYRNLRLVSKDRHVPAYDVATFWV
jgi:PIN domain nuclease of toxin-antitoxin system